jgi:HAD superfamily hydrolase (TIGR01459 family)
MPKASTKIPILPSIAPLAATCEAWITDIWGVLHNGVAAFPEACQAARSFRAKGGIVVLLSNAPRPQHSVAAQLDELGVPREAYDAIVTSGDLTRRLIAETRCSRVFHIGHVRHTVLFEGLDITFAPETGADIFLCTGLADDEAETPDDYRAVLERLAARRVNMICGNPDIRVERGERLVYCAGALAELYERLGGTVTYAGKPHAAAYEMAFEAVAKAKGTAISRSRILAIGDGVKTDIDGAAAAGLRSVFIASQLHVEGRLTSAKLARLFAGHPAPPVAAQAALVW